MNLFIHHTTRYAYDAPVSLSVHAVRLFPRLDPFTKLLWFRFDAPGARAHFRRDLFENTCAHCFFPDPQDHMEYHVELQMEIPRHDPFDFLLESRALQWPVEYSAAEAHSLAPCLSRRTTDRLDGFWQPVPNAPVLETLLELNGRFSVQFSYAPRQTGEARSPGATLSERGGACRDYGWLLTELLREHGLAARMVSGYLFEEDLENRRAEGSLHAWAEVYLPGAGWVGLDPTHGILASHTFVPTAVGVEPADVAAISGTYFSADPVESRMESRVEILKTKEKA